ncbi:signal peptidase I [Streptacidiphilus jiangxiensis]|uniref:Signal peptidase I n=1 Tax=Streptacidiphilus jiangxiensis TaxID=235985 RepID=A0A1H7TPN7_STRJI|nr:signal peptidase I [Streptacidiphilus jiangxiensis]SEL86711.1 signal peptidase I [Streptacidiphilus jiangxiensis]
MTAVQPITPHEGEVAVAPKRRRWVFRLALVLLGLGTVLTVTGGARTLGRVHDYAVPTTSMTPTLRSGDHVMTVPLDGAVPQRGDLVVVDGSAWGIPGLTLRRVIGVGGDRVACCAGGGLTVGGRALVEPYAASANGGLPGYSVTVPPERLFLLGDNRADAVDSRMHLAQDQGTLPLTAVSGRVIWSSRGGWIGRNGDSSVIAYFVALGAGLLLFVLGLVVLLVSAVLALVRRSRQRQAVGPAVRDRTM